MKEIVNRTARPLKVPLPGGRFLHLGPRKTGQVSEKATRLPSFRKLVEAGEIAVVEAGERPAAGSGDSSGLQESTQGHHPPTVVLPKGNR